MSAYTPADTHPLAGDPRAWADSPPSNHEVAKYAVAATLSGRSYDDRISAAELAARTPVSASTVRDLVAELRHDGMPVVSFGSGYFEIQSPDRFREAMQRQERRREKARSTQRQLAAAFYGDGGDAA